jgi:hypothetical protein
MLDWQIKEFKIIWFFSIQVSHYDFWALSIASLQISGNDSQYGSREGMKELGTNKCKPDFKGLSWKNLE